MVPMAKIPSEKLFFLQHSNAVRAAKPLVSSRRIIDNGPRVIPIEHNETYAAVPTLRPSSGEFPAYAAVIVAVLLSVMTSTFFYFLCRCLARKKKRQEQLDDLTPRATDHRMTGVRADQPIQFVVPTTVIVSETTEDSVSETDYYYSSGGARMMDRRRKKFQQIDPDDLQHGLYTPAAVDRSTGTVGFSLRYNSQRSQLTVRVIGARGLACHSPRTTPNPCVKLALLPDKHHHVTKVLKNTTSPDFDESFTFCGVGREELPDKRLKMSVWDYDRFSRKCLIGQVLYNLRDSGLTRALSAADATSGEIWADLKQDSVSQEVVMLLSLCYDPDTATLTLTVLKIRGLEMQRDKAKDTAIYAKVTLYVRRKLVRTKKTPSRKKAPEVELNSPFSIHVPQAALPQVDLMVALCEKWPLGKRLLGRTRAGADCLCDQGLQHWQDMLDSPKSTCAQWHVLYG